MFEVLLTDSAREFYEGADSPLQRRLDRCFEALQTEPRRHPNVRPLRGRLRGFFRYRVGDYRVVYQIEDEAQRVIVQIIAHRSEVYDR